MTGITETGFENKEYSEVVDSLNTNAKSEFGEDFDTTPDSVMGVLNSINAVEVKQLWDITEAVFNNFDRDKAEGINLDHLAALIGLSRLKASGSTGLITYLGNNGTFIPAGFQVKDTEGKIVSSKSSLTLSNSGSYTSHIQVETVAPTTLYTIVLNGSEYTYFSDTDSTITEILDGLKLAIDSSSEPVTTSISLETLLIKSDSRNNILTTSVSGNLLIYKIESLMTNEALIDGEVYFPADTLITPVNPIVGLDEVTNDNDFQLGRLAETDSELRQRMALREQSTGTATVPSIEASITEIEGVDSTVIIENTEEVPDIDGRPAKSYETYVDGGDEDLIAAVVWETKPAGIKTVGTINKVVIDKNGRQQSVRFSRPDELYAHVRVTYQLYDEELFPSGGEARIQDAVVAYGNALGNGTDIIPTRFYAPIYASVSGVDVSEIEIGLTTTVGGIPVYQTSKIPVSLVERVRFDQSRVIFA